MKIFKTANYNNQQGQQAKMDIANDLLDWHGGQSSGLYSVGSSWLAGHFDVPEENIKLAILELDDLINKKVNYPDTMTEQDIIELKQLKQRLQQLTTEGTARTNDGMLYDEDTYKTDY